MQQQRLDERTAKALAEAINAAYLMLGGKGKTPTVALRPRRNLRGTSRDGYGLSTCKPQRQSVFPKTNCKGGESNQTRLVAKPKETI